MSRKDLILLHSPRAIEEAVAGLARAIDADAGGRPLTVIGVLKGSFIFLADLVRKLQTPLSLDFVRVKSYGKGVFPGEVRLIKDVEIPLHRREVLIVDDIMDTGLTARFLMRHARKRRPRSCRLCVLLDKPSRRLTRIVPDYSGFVIPDVFAVGYGLDCNERYRGLPALYALNQPVPAAGRSRNG